MRWLIFLVAALIVLSAEAAGAQTPSAPSVAAANLSIAAMAKAERRGLYPRAFVDEQPYWTLLGADGGDQSGLISEDGAIELAKGDVSLEPFVIEDG